MSKYVSIITVTYINSSEAIASQALAENMMEKIALDNGCDRVRCYLSGEVTRLIVFEYNEETIQKKVISFGGYVCHVWAWRSGGLYRHGGVLAGTL
mgnify:CR=1 FL=1